MTSVSSEVAANLARIREGIERAAVRSGEMLSGLAHFVLYGAQEGRLPNKDFEIEIGNCVILGQLCRADEFEQDFYLTEYNVAKHFVKWFPIFTAYKFFTTYGRRMGHVPQRAQKISFESVHSDRLCMRKFAGCQDKAVSQ